MDTERFDHLARTFSTPETRRGLLRFIAALPLAGTLAPLVDGEAEAAAKKDPERGGSHRRRKRKRRHDPGEDKDKRKGQRKGKGNSKRTGKQPCTNAGTRPTKGRPCCPGLSRDGGGLCAQPAAEPAPPPPPTRPGPGPRRTTMTRTFSNTTPITIFPGAGISVATPAAPYPSLIEVAGLANGRILDVNLTLHGVSHPWPDDIDILLAAAHLPGLNAVVMSDVGLFTAVSDVTLTLDDQTATALPKDDGFASGTFKPTNHSGYGAEEFPSPAPVPSGNVALSVFTGSDPNGTWQLFIVDDDGNAGGQVANGWSLEITAEVDA